MLVVAGVLDELADELADALADELADELAAGPTALTTLAEQMTRAPPPLAEPWHCRIVTGRAEAIVPVAVQVSPTRVPPLAVPLHCVIAALVVVAGNGSQLIVWPTIPLAPEPTHWFTDAAVDPGLTHTKLLVTLTLQRRVPPPPLMESLH